MQNCYHSIAAQIPNWKVSSLKPPPDCATPHHRQSKLTSFIVIQTHQAKMNKKHGKQMRQPCSFPVMIHNQQMLG